MESGQLAVSELAHPAPAAAAAAPNSGPRRGGSAEVAGDSAHELADIERLGQEPGGACGENGVHGGLAGIAAEDDDWDRGGRGSGDELPQNLGTSDVGQAQVEQDEVGRVAGGGLEAVAAGLGGAQPDTGAATWRRSRSITCFPASGSGRSTVAVAPALIAARIAASAAISRAAVASAARSARRSPSAEIIPLTLPTGPATTAAGQLTPSSRATRSLACPFSQNPPGPPP